MRVLYIVSRFILLICIFTSFLIKNILNSYFGNLLHKSGGELIDYAATLMELINEARCLIFCRILLLAITFSHIDLCYFSIR